MDYPFENLSPEKFQLFCQALLTKEFPNIQCMPVAQPDGGRDAVQFFISSNHADFNVFQVKFVRQPNECVDVHKWLEKVVGEELPKIKKLMSSGAKKFILLTNLPGTAHPQAGTIDRLNKELAELFEIPASCWWRNDLARRLDDSWSIKWMYPELMTGPDFIRCIFESGVTDHKERRLATITTFLAYQYQCEEEVKFKQVDLQNKLMKLFIDVPVSAMHRMKKGQNIELQYLDVDIAEDLLHIYQGEDLRNTFRNGERTIGAATYLLHQNLQRKQPFVVLEGAPGQGKSTITSIFVKYLGCSY